MRQAQQRIIHLNETRIEYDDATDQQKEWATAVGLLTNTSKISFTGNCSDKEEVSFDCTAVADTSEDILCAGESWSSQSHITPTCTAFMIGPDIFATAGHCVGLNDCSGKSVILRWRPSPGTFPGGNPNILEQHIYECTDVLAHGGSTDPGLTNSGDWAVFRVDRPVTGGGATGGPLTEEREPLPTSATGRIQGNAITTIGHPVGLPTKIDPDGTVGGPAPRGPFAFYTFLDVAAGQSGSPVIDNASGDVIGILTGAQGPILDETNGCYNFCVAPPGGDECDPQIGASGDDRWGSISIDIRAIPQIYRPTSIVVGSFDITVLVEEVAGFIHVYGDSSGSSFTESTGLVAETGWEGQTHLAVGDFDDDGVFDLLVVSGDEAVVYRGNGAAAAGTFPYFAPTTLDFTTQDPLVGTYTAVEVEDLDGDGIDDVRAIASDDSETTFLGSAAGLVPEGFNLPAADEYVMILLDQSGSMTAAGTAAGSTRWDDAINAATQWVEFESDAAWTRAYSVWTFRNSAGEDDTTIQIWPQSGDSSCATTDPDTGFCILSRGATTEYQKLQAFLEDAREEHRAVAGPSTPLAGTLCDSLETLRGLPTVKRIILESDGGENSTPLSHPCQGDSSEDFTEWDVSLDDWGMTLNSWQAKVIRRATRFDQDITSALTGPLTSADAFPGDLIWLVDAHFESITPGDFGIGTDTSDLATFEWEETTGGDAIYFDNAPVQVLDAPTLPADSSLSAVDYALFANLAQTTGSKLRTFVRTSEDEVFGVHHEVPADVNDDECVDQSDLDVMLAPGIWGGRFVDTASPGALADLTGDGWVNYQDLRVLLNNWGLACTGPVDPPNLGGRPLPESIQIDACSCNPNKCQDCQAPLQACEDTPGCMDIVTCTYENECSFPHEECSSGKSCHELTGHDQASAAGQAANNFISCLGGCDAPAPIDPCENGVQDQDESDVDCGGVCGATCEVGDDCTTADDCFSGACTDEVCEAATTCTEASAIDLGAPGQTHRVPNDSCLRVLDGYPTWWGTRSMVLLVMGDGSYPTPFVWTSSCTSSDGSGTFFNDWESKTLSTTDASCATLIELKGDGSGELSLRYY